MTQNNLDPFALCDRSRGLLVAKLLASEDSKLASMGKVVALCEDDIGISWQKSTDFSWQDQLVPEQLKEKYEEGISLMTTDNEVHVNTDADSDLDQSFSLDYGAKSTATAAAVSYDHEGLTPLKTPVSTSTSVAEDFMTVFRSGTGPGANIGNIGTVGSSRSPASVRVMKRVDVVPWDDYFMAIAFLSAMRSKDPSTQVCQCQSVSAYSLFN
jgi:hypothetical protein